MIYKITLKKNLSSNPKTLTFGRVYDAIKGNREEWDLTKTPTYSIINDNGNRIMVSRNKFNVVTNKSERSW